MNTHFETTHVAVVRDVSGFRDTLAVHLWKRCRDGGVTVPDPLVMRHITREEMDNAVERGPLVVLTNDEARAFMDGLWAAGVRPSNGEGSVGEIAAVRAHLADMQRLVFKENRTP